MAHSHGWQIGFGGWLGAQQDSWDLSSSSPKLSMGFLTSSQHVAWFQKQAAQENQTQVTYPFLIQPHKSH